MVVLYPVTEKDMICGTALSQERLFLYHDTHQRKSLQEHTKASAKMLDFRRCAMNKYIYPAIFEKEETGYSVFFPDIDGCYTCGDSLEDAMDMAEDVLSLVLYTYETDGKTIPTPSDCSAIQTDEQSFVSLIKCDTLEYRKRFSNKAVKKTLTIPEWMNDEATKLGINFSQLLQEALMQKLNL